MIIVKQIQVSEKGGGTVSILVPFEQKGALAALAPFSIFLIFHFFMPINVKTEENTSNYALQAKFDI